MKKRLVPTVTLRDLSLSEELALLSAWAPRPGPWSSDRWPTWEAYLATHAAVADELREAFGDRFRYLRGGDAFAAQAQRYADRFGLDALKQARYEDIRAGRKPAAGNDDDDGGGTPVCA